MKCRSVLNQLFLRCVWVSHIVHPDWKRPHPHFCDVFVWNFMLDFKNNIKQCLRFNDSVEVERHSYNFLLLSWLWAYNNRKENCKIWSLTNKTPMLYSFTVLANHLKFKFLFLFYTFFNPNCICKTTLSRRFTKMPLWLSIVYPSVPLAENFYFVSSCLWWNWWSSTNAFEWFVFASYTSCHAIILTNQTLM